MWILYDNIAVVMVSLLTCAFAWLYGGTMPSASLPVIPWLLVFLVDIMICFPQRHRGESIYDARERTWFMMKKDPLTWAVLFFVVILLIPFVNKGLCQICDYAAINLDGANPKPPVPVLPFCVDRSDHLTVVLWFVPALAAMLAVKHALLKRGKRAVLAVVVYNGLLLSIIGVLQQVTGADFPLWQSQYIRGKCVYFFSTFGYSNMGGDYFTTLFAISMALWRWDVERAYAEEDEGDADALTLDKRSGFWRKHFMLVPAVVFFLSALATLSRAAILLVSVLAVLMFGLSFVRSFSRLAKVQKLRAIVASLVVLVSIVLAALYGMSGELGKQFKGTTSVEVFDRISGRQQLHAKVALEILKDYPFFGCGGWGYKHFALSKIGKEHVLFFKSPGAVNVHNDYLQFMVEHGVVGFAILVSIVYFLFKPLVSAWRHLASSIRFKPPKRPLPRPTAVFVFPAPALFIMLSALATLVHAFADCPFRSPAILTLFFVSLAAADGFLPRIKRH